MIETQFAKVLTICTDIINSNDNDDENQMSLSLRERTLSVWVHSLRREASEHSLINETRILPTLGKKLEGFKLAQNISNDNYYDLIKLATPFFPKAVYKLHIWKVFSYVAAQIAQGVKSKDKVPPKMNQAILLGISKENTSYFRFVMSPLMPNVFEILRHELDNVITSLISLCEKKISNLTFSKFVVYQLESAKFLQKYCNEILELIILFIQQKYDDIEINLDEYLKSLFESNWLHLLYTILKLDISCIGINNKILVIQLFKIITPYIEPNHIINNSNQLGHELINHLTYISAKEFLSYNDDTLAKLAVQKSMKNYHQLFDHAADLMYLIANIKDSKWQQLIFNQFKQIMNDINYICNNLNDQNNDDDDQFQKQYASIIGFFNNIFI